MQNANLAPLKLALGFSLPPWPPFLWFFWPIQSTARRTSEHVNLPPPPQDWPLASPAIMAQAKCLGVGYLGGGSSAAPAMCALWLQDPLSAAPQRKAGGG